MIALDASVLIALPPVDEHHVPAGRLLAEHAGGGFAVHPLDLADVLVGGVRIGREEEMLADLREMAFDDALAVVARQHGVEVLPG